jgi:hypothetical protein
MRAVILIARDEYRRETMPTLYLLMALCISNHGGDGAWYPANAYISKAQCEAELKNAEASVKEMAAYPENAQLCAKAIVQAKCVRYSPRP